MTRLILASGSAARRRMLADAGISFQVNTADVDEAALRKEMGVRGASTEETATALAIAKASAVARLEPGALVLGSDQILDLDGIWLEKPADAQAAAEQLRQLRGRSHRFVSAVVACRGDAVIWRAVDAAELEMRGFSEAFLDAYLGRVGSAACASVGAYQLEGLGAQLFSSVRGDFFTVLGMPLLPVLGFLREQGVLTT